MYEFRGRDIGGGCDPPICGTIRLIVICLGDPMEKRDGISLPLRMFDAAMAGNYTKEERLGMLEEQGMDINELLEKDIDSLSKRELEMVEAVLDAKAEDRAILIEKMASMVMAAMERLGISAEDAMYLLEVETDFREEILVVIESRT